jgi:hypothetical protein
MLKLVKSNQLADKQENPRWHQAKVEGLSFSEVLVKHNITLTLLRLKDITIF